MRIINYIKKPYKIFEALDNRGIIRISDEQYLKMVFRNTMKSRLNLQFPQTFNEKLQWLKLYDRNPEYADMVDKYKVREYIKNKIGEEYLIPLLGVYDKFDDINFDELPEQFVIKCNHDSGGVVICKNKKDLNINKLKKKINKSLKRNYFYNGREYPYKNIAPKIVIEKLMENDGKEIADHKVHNFNGRPKVILVCQDRFKDTGLTEDFFSDKWEHLDIQRPNHPNAKQLIQKPVELEEMLKLSRILSKDIPFVRTDFYVINHKIYFGEMTFYPASGFERFIPEEWDEVFGSWLDLPTIDEKR